jgi:hypothetical protein
MGDTQVTCPYTSSVVTLVAHWFLHRINGFGDNASDLIASASRDLPKYSGAVEPAQSPNVIVAVTQSEIVELGGKACHVISCISGSK